MVKRGIPQRYKRYRSEIIYAPKKSLGQNFLFDKNHLHKIVACCPVDDKIIIIEIGSGYGNLTNLLAKTDCQKVIGIEKDSQLFQWLIENNKNEKIIYHHQDALKINWPEFCSQFKNNSLIVVGNLPYYITNSLIINLLLDYQLFKSLIFLVQKEVGQKWVSGSNKYPSEYSALSVFINYLTETKIVAKIPAAVFTPAPSVDGVLVSIEPHQNVNTSKEQLISFLRFLKNCFRFRRKTLLNNLLSWARNYEKEWKKYLQEKGYEEKIRPQNLNPSEYWQLFVFWRGLA
ncbi:16S rRNA (adenine(1518)-N(6)/adenine(1519)-N(6))-dimethyltransferase RsmA [endosymbiont DhMRE of Dentiscutata heterogama]|uniref:16S rRNA (adenine(1518)-N(6)/adenine(1519)-N(6))- dimethyltransferase RsmA n=1 Tax=endosymbiont DhMRE of Dentiscutata heterogama TaxID=1609546 RepID=UPI002AD289EA|nr:16S rRNA (adenine(1518)-N(6)/adenine(1519)-N(6))-dimethyltransferase RsmA [endosymbiont DhMRE of Dentiscutata heterogama]